MYEDSRDPETDSQHYAHRAIHSSHIKETRHLTSFEQKTANLRDTSASNRLFSANESIAEMSSLNCCHCAVRHSLRCSQIKTGQLKSIQSSHDLGD
jgi:hypothetical protein